MAGEQILVVDDNVANATLAATALEAQGYEVRIAESGAGLWEALKTFHPRVILMDIHLPDANGLQLTQQLKESPETKDIAIIVATAYAMKSDQVRARAVGCDGYITKPIDTRTLARTVAAHL